MNFIVLVLLLLILAVVVALFNMTGEPVNIRRAQVGRAASPLRSPRGPNPTFMDLTEDQKKITQKFGQLACAVTCASEKILYSWTKQARDPSSLRWIPENVKALKELVFAADVFVVCQVTTDSEEQVVREAFAKCGLTPTISPHKILFYEAPISKEAILRQLAPKYHFDNDAEFSSRMQKYVPNVVLVQPDDTCGSSSVGSLEIVAKLEEFWAIEMEKTAHAPANTSSGSLGLTQRKPGTLK